MSRRTRILLFAAIAIVVLPMLGILVLGVAGNTDSGRRFIERTTDRLTRGQVHLQGLAGRFPDRLRLDHLELKDGQGLWLQADQVELSSSPLELLGKVARVDLLRASKLSIPRAPDYGASKTSQNSSSGMWLHELRLDRLEVQRLELGASLVADPVALQIQASARIYSLQLAWAQLRARRLDSVPSKYEATAQIDAKQINVHVDLEEEAGGPLTHLAGMPQLGALALHLQLAGPREAVQTSLDLHAGPLVTSVKGTVNLTSGAADLAVDADSQAITPIFGVSWQRLSLHGTWHGTASAPTTTARLEAAGVVAPDVQAKNVQADLRGEGARLLLDGNVGGFRLVSPSLVMPDSDPVIVHAEAKFGDRSRPIDFTLRNTLLNLRGHWNITTIDGSASATITDIKPFVALGGLNLRGSGTLDVKFAITKHVPRLDASTDLDIRGGAAPMALLLRPHARAECALLFRENGIEFDNAHVDTASSHASLTGSILGGTLDLGWKASLSKLAALSPQLAGDMSASGAIKGQSPNLTLDADAAGQLSAHGSVSGPLHLVLHARDLPQHTNGSLDLTGSLDGAPIDLSANAQAAADGSVSARIEHGDWKSAHAQGAIHVDAKAERPEGRIELHIAQLSDLDRLIGQALQGSIDASVAVDGRADKSRAQITIDAKDIGVPAQQIAQLQVRGYIDTPTTAPTLALRLDANGQLTGRQSHLNLQARGPLSKLELNAKGNLDAAGDGEGPVDAAAQLDTAATLNLDQSELRLTALKVDYRKQELTLRAPAVIRFGDGLSFDPLRLASADGELQASGRIAPTLDLRASASNLSSAQLRALMPELSIDGRINADAELAGTVAQPTGHIELHAIGLRAGAGAARGLPATNIDAKADLAQTTAQVDLEMHAGGGLDLKLTGQAPLNSAATMLLKVNGAFDLDVLNPILEAGGQRAQGKVQIDAQFDGTPAAPQAHGTLQLAHVNLQDYSRGARLTDVNATLDADGDTLQLKEFTARAGTGTISAEGTVKLGEGSWPVNLKLSGHDAQPLASDLLSANANLDLTLVGDLRGKLDAGGTVHVNRAVINIPNALPPDVNTLNVVRAGQKPPPPPKPSNLVVALDFKVSAPRAVFVRGRGIDAELGGEAHVGGTAADVSVSGGFEMRNGTVNLAGTTLIFTDGRVSFNGSGVKKKIDPTLDFSATNNTGAGAAATLHVGGFADAPVITLSSIPEMPQDQILSQLLFGSSVSQLSTLQLAQIGAALATMGGIGAGGGGFNPINTVQRKLGLDRLSIGGGASSNGSGGGGSTSTLGNAPGANNENNAATIEAGRYVTSRVYVGAKQSTAGPTQAQVQIDLTKRLKVQATLGTGGGSVQGATPQNDPGSSAGIAYQFEY
jgi:translocation and assembly module TamB